MGFISTVLIIGLLASNLILMSYLIIFPLGSEAAQCTLNPIQFGIKQLEENNKYPVQCTCNLLSPNPSESLLYTSEGVSNQRPLDVENTNFSSDFSDFEGVIQNWKERLDTDPKP